MQDKCRNWLEDLKCRSKSISVITGFDQHWYPARTIESHSHEYYQIDYFYKGQGKMTISGSDYSVKPGDLYVCNPGDLHRYQAASEKPMENIALKFEFISREKLVEFPNHVGNLGLLSRDQQQDLENHLARACVEANKSSEESLILATAFLEVFLILLTSYLKDVELAASEKAQDYCSVVMGYIKRHYEHQITLNDLARITGIHPKYLCHKFSTQMGIPPMEVLSQMRIEAAKKLLTNTTLPITEVALRVGYMNIAHFSKRFKELTGVSPRDFRTREASAFHEHQTG